MTQPTPPRQITAADAAAALAAAQAALAAQDAVGATVLDLSRLVTTTRDVAAAYAKVMISALWADTDPYDGNAVQAFTESAAAHMVTAQTTTARSAAAAQAAILRSMNVTVPGVPSNPTDVRAPGADVVGGRLVLRRPETVAVKYSSRGGAIVTAEDMSTQGMFNRPARTVRAEIAAGATPAQADTKARDRIDRLVEDNVMLAQRFAEMEVLQAAVDLDAPREPRVIGYRRVIHPELSETGVCGLCIAAADQKYKVGDLLPLHNRCKCTVAAITEDHDPGDDVNSQDLEALYGLAGGTDGRQLKRVRYQVDEHGELGPTLVPKKPYKPRDDTYVRGPRRTKRSNVSKTSRAERARARHEARANAARASRG